MTANELAEKLSMYGIDYADAMDRFGQNAVLYEHLAMKYLNDEHFVGFKAAMEVADYDNAYREAHSLKGVAGNLSLLNLYNAASEVTRFLSEGEYQAAAHNLPSLNDAHIKTIKGLEAWRDGTL